MNEREASIFVSMASYRDSECPATLADLFAKAECPRRVIVGVLWQVVPGSDRDCESVPAAVPAGQVRGLREHASRSLGPCWARSRIQRELWRGEEFYLQIDSHMRFTAGWDTRLLRMYRQCGVARAVLATYPASYTPPGTFGPPLVPVLEPTHFDDHGMLRLRGLPLAADAIPQAPIAQAFVAAGFLFGPGSVIEDAPYDPHIYFHGEEVSLAARLWTHGYDLFAPNEHVLWHDYSTERARPKHWSDHRDWSLLNRRSMARVRHLLGMEHCEDAVTLIELERHGLGAQRSLAAYEAFAGVDFRARTIAGK